MRASNAPVAATVPAERQYKHAEKSGIYDLRALSRPRSRTIIEQLATRHRPFSVRSLPALLAASAARGAGRSRAPGRIVMGALAYTRAPSSVKERAPR